MKITKRQLKKIIKEEKQKLLVEMNPVANAQRSLGAYADVADVDKLGTALLDLLQGIEMSAIEDGIDEEEAEDMAANAAVMAVAEAFQSAGLIAEYNALLMLVQRG